MNFSSIVFYHFRGKINSRLAKIVKRHPLAFIIFIIFWLKKEKIKLLIKSNRCIQYKDSDQTNKL